MLSKTWKIIGELGEGQKRCLLFAFAALLLCYQVARLDGPDILVDDAFISFRYAVNLSRGLGLVFNPGERVEGYTNFLWTVLLSGCHSLGWDLALSSKVAAMLFALGTLVLLLLLGERLWAERNGRLGLTAIPVVLFAGMGSQARYVVSGMETLFFAFMVTLAVYTYLVRGPSLAAGVAFAVAAMTRPEGLMYFALALVHLVGVDWPAVRHELRLRPLLWFIGSFALVYGIYYWWRWSYYGYPLPNTFYAKASGFYWGRLLRGWRMLLEVVSMWCIGLVIVLSALSLLSIRGSRTWLLPLGMVVATAAYFIFVGGDFVVWFGPRFLVPALPMLLLTCAEGLSWISRIRPLSGRAGKALQIALAGYLFISAFWFSWPGRFPGKEEFSAQMRGWAELGRWIAANTPPEATIATDAAGLIPFYSERYAIDMYGLTDAHIAHLEVLVTEQSVAAHEKSDPRYILARGPDYVVSTWIDEDGRALSSGLSTVADEFAAHYELLAVSKVRRGPPRDGRWIIVTSRYSPELYEQGYVTGLFRRRVPPGA